MESESAGLRAYIDESGDEGFKFGQGSSRFFVISAIVVDKSRDLQTVRVVEEVRKVLNLNPKTQLHWKKLNPYEKKIYSEKIGSIEAWGISICINKPELNAKEFQEYPRLYFYTMRYLLERLSWLARELQKGKVELVFSKREHLAYDELQNYIGVLKTHKAFGQKVEIDFRYVKTDFFTILSPGKSMGLQLSDAFAGACFNAFERSYQKEVVDLEFLKLMAAILYRRKGKLEGYGLKVFPKSNVASIMESISIIQVEK